MSRIETLYELHPEKFKEKIERECKYADIKRFRKYSILLGVIGAIISTGLLSLLPYGNRIIAGAAVVLAPTSYFFLPYMVFSVAAERRKKEIEKVLPDALLLISTNIKSGSSINRAFLAGAREEFGPLEDELQKTAIEITGGTPVKQALDNLRHRTNSEIFQDALNVLSDAMESGGNTAELLESTAEDIRSSLELREEVSSNIRMYVIFILMAAVFGAPVLFSITVYMSETTTQMWAQNDLTEGVGNFAQGGQSGLQFQQPDVNTDFLVQFSVLALIITNTFGGLIISQIRNGNIKEGAKYIPLTVTTAVIIFISLQSVLGNIL